MDSIPLGVHAKSAPGTGANKEPAGAGRQPQLPQPPTGEGGLLASVSKGEIGLKPYS